MSDSIKTTMNGREWAMLLALSVLWGGSFFFVGVIVHALPPLTIVTLRVGIAALALWCFAAATGRRPPRSLGAWRAFLAMGLLNNVVPFSLIVWGQIHIASGLASILNATTPLFTVIVAGAMLADERMTALKLAGTAIGFAGVAVMLGSSGLAGAGNVLAQAAVLGAALSYAFAGVFGRRFRSMGIDPIVTAAGQVTASAALLAPVALYVDGPIDVTALGLDAWSSILGLAVLSTAAAYVLYFRILEAAGATNLLLVTLLIPVSAILLGSLVLGETLEAAHFAGMAFIAVGLSAIDGRLWPRFVGDRRAEG